MSKHCFAYLRVSTQKQGVQGISLQEQRSAITSYAGRKGLNIIEWYEECQTAAKLGRPKFDDMMRRVRGGEADGVVMHKLDRSARNISDWAAVSELIDTGIEFHFAIESIDLASRGGRLTADMLAAVAADYSRNLRTEAIKGFYGRLKQGLYPLAAPIGYIDNGRGKVKTPDPEKAPIIAKAFELYATGEYSLKALRKEMNLTNRNGGPVSMNGWSTILNNPFYYGLIRLKKTDETFPGIHKPIIAKQTFDKVQYILNGKIGQRLTKHDFLFRRIFACGLCGYAMIGERKKGHVYYRCHTSSCKTTGVREEELTAQVNEYLQRCTLPASIANGVQAMIDDHCAKADVQSKEYYQAHSLTLENVKKRSNRLANAFLDGAFSKEEFKQRKAEYDLEQSGIVRKLANCPPNGDEMRAHLSEKLGRFRYAYVTYFYGDFRHKRNIIKLATSNRSISAKKAHLEPSKQWREIQNLQKLDKCDHPRGNPRIICKCEESFQTQSKQVFTMLLDEFHAG